jgi:hypothetical protein
MMYTVEMGSGPFSLSLSLSLALALSLSLSLSLYIYIYICVCVCVCLEIVWRDTEKTALYLINLMLFFIKQNCLKINF